MKSPTPNSRNHFSLLKNIIFTRLARLRLLGFAMLTLLVFNGCDTEEVSETQSEVLKETNSTESYRSSDNFDNKGTEGFYFLPPMVNNTAFSGDFDPDLNPVVEICETQACDLLHASFDMNGEGSEGLRLELQDEHYIVNWNTNTSGAVAGQTYRVRVRVNDIILDYADVHVVSNQSQAQQYLSQGMITIVANQTLPIKFRVETGIVGSVVVEPAESTIDIGETQQFTALLFDLHGDPLTGPTVAWSSESTDVAGIDSDGLATGQSAGEVTISATSGPAAGSAQLTVTAITGSSFFLADNGITIRCPDATIGDKGVVGDKEYEAVDRELLIQRRGEGGDLTCLCTSSVTNMNFIFSSATNFNQDISGWDTGNVISMSQMFQNATSFNQDIGSWDTGNVTNMSSMFSGATSFNQPIGGWDIGNVISLNGMFNNATSFNQPVGGWDTENVQNMGLMFNGATAFNQPIGDWDTGNVISLNAMFGNATSFNQPIEGWDTGNVVNMALTFWGATSFNQDIGGWDTANATSISGMFWNAAAFNQDLSSWCVSLIPSIPFLFDSGATNWVLPRPIWGTCP